MRWNDAERSAMSRIVVDAGPWQAAPRALPAWKAIFAIGDVHSHADHLWTLHERISGIIADMIFRPLSKFPSTAQAV